MNIEDMPVIQGPVEFLLDYKILIFVLIILVVSIILACKKKSWRKAMITLGASDVILTMVYVYNRIYVTNQIFESKYFLGTDKRGYRNFIGTDNSFDELASFIIWIAILFLVVFICEKVIEKIVNYKKQ